MLGSVEKLKLKTKEVLCYDLTFGYMSDVSDGAVVETTNGVIVNGTDLTEEDLRDFRVSELDVIYKTIIKLTYPQLHDEDGNLKSIDEDVDDTIDDKKKL